MEEKVNFKRTEDGHVISYPDPNGKWAIKHPENTHWSSGIDLYDKYVANSGKSSIVIRKVSHDGLNTIIVKYYTISRFGWINKVYLWTIKLRIKLGFYK